MRRVSLCYTPLESGVFELSHFEKEERLEKGIQDGDQDPRRRRDWCLTSDPSNEFFKKLPKPRGGARVDPGTGVEGGSPPISQDPRRYAGGGCLDHIFVSRRHRQPVVANARVQFAQAPEPFLWKNKPIKELSSRYPIKGTFAFADPLPEVGGLLDFENVVAGLGGDSPAGAAPWSPTSVGSKPS